MSKFISSPIKYLITPTINFVTTCKGDNSGSYPIPCDTLNTFQEIILLFSIHARSGIEAVIRLAVNLAVNLFPVYLSGHFATISWTQWHISSKDEQKAQFILCN